MTTYAPTQPTARPASDKQLAFIRNLLAERQGVEAAESVRSWLNEAREADLLNTRTASRAIEHLMAIPKGSPSTQPVTLEDGIYRAADGQIVKVYHTVHGRNVQVGKRLSVHDNHDGTYTGQFVYVGKSLLIGLTPEMMLTHEQAAEFGKIYGFCVRCGLDLTLEESVAVGYGRTCASLVRVVVRHAAGRDHSRGRRWAGQPPGHSRLPRVRHRPAHDRCSLRWTVTSARPTAGPTTW